MCVFLAHFICNIKTYLTSENLKKNRYFIGHRRAVAWILSIKLNYSQRALKTIKSNVIIRIGNIQRFEK